MRRIRNVKYYDTGGYVDSKQKKADALTGSISGGLGLIASFADSLDTPDAYGHQSTGTNLLKGAATGVAAGSAAGPLGAAIGGTLGLVGGIVTSAKQRREEAKNKAIEADTLKQNQIAKYAAEAAQNPFLTTGYKNESYYSNGGDLKQQYMRYRSVGGSLSALSSDTVEVKGPSHKNGGVDLPDVGANVEGGETIKGDYVLSKKLGFAQIHKPIAKAIGILEKKPVTASTLSSLKRLRDKEQALMVLQEFVKSQNNLE